MGSSAMRKRACIALSLMVGMPSGRIFPFFLGMYTRLSGFGLYPLNVKELMALQRSSGVSQVSPSTPAVLPPLFDVTRLTAKALAANEFTKICWRLLTLPTRFAFRAFTILTCSLRTSASHRVQLMDCQRFSTAGDAHMACATLH